MLLQSKSQTVLWLLTTYNYFCGRIVCYWDVWTWRKALNKNVRHKSIVILKWNEVKVESRRSCKKKMYRNIGKQRMLLWETQKVFQYWNIWADLVHAKECVSTSRISRKKLPKLSESKQFSLFLQVIAYTNSTLWWG